MRILLAEHLDNCHDVIRYIVINSKFAYTEPELGWSGHSQPLNPCLTPGCRVHREHLVNLVENGPAVENSQFLELFYRLV